MYNIQNFLVHGDRCVENINADFVRKKNTKPVVRYKYTPDDFFFFVFPIRRRRKCMDKV